ncbi:hypothetical protein [Antribacter gilvus]|uniref:hypothetical protein n=1 Tax=Antribacter gilvus TaxID=2304675 RepID=UPI000F7B4DBB|nr:hypothetical protein [Antribacter gilvus]
MARAPRGTGGAPGDGDRPAARRTRARAGGFHRAFELFGETLLVGVLVALGSVLVITAVPSVAVGVAHLRRHVAGGDTTFGRLGHEWVAAVRDLWLPGLTLVGAGLVVAANAELTATGALPGADAVRWVTWVAGAAAVVVHLRAAGAWTRADGEPGEPGGPGGPGRPRGTRALAAGWAATRDDLTGSALLVTALGLVAVLVWMYGLFTIIVGGLLCLAVVGVEARRREPPSSR